MYTLLKRLFIVIITKLIFMSSGKYREQEGLSDEQIKNKFGENAYILKVGVVNPEDILPMNDFLLRAMVVLGFLSTIAMAIITILSHEKEYIIYCFIIPICYIVIYLAFKINGDIYKYTRDIIAEDKVIIRRPYKEDRIITYSEIHEAAKNKKIVMRGRFLYIPTNGKPIKMYVLRADLRQLAIDRIREKANIPIPEITERRQGYIGIVSLNSLARGCCYILLVAALLSAIGNYENFVGEYIHTLLTKESCKSMLEIGIAGILIIRLHYMLVSLKLRKDINDQKYVKIKL